MDDYTSGPRISRQLHRRDKRPRMRYKDELLTMPGVHGWAHNSEAIQLEQSLSHRWPPILPHSGIYSGFKSFVHRTERRIEEPSGSIQGSNTSLETGVETHTCRDDPLTITKNLD